MTEETGVTPRCRRRIGVDRHMLSFDLNGNSMLADIGEALDAHDLDRCVGFTGVVSDASDQIEDDRAMFMVTPHSSFLVHFLACDGFLALPLRTFEVTAEDEVAALAQAKRLARPPFCPLPSDSIQVLNDKGLIVASWRISADIHPNPHVPP